MTASTDDLRQELIAEAEEATAKADHYQVLLQDQVHPCPHEWRCGSSWGGNPFRDEMLRVFPQEEHAKFGLGGYQIHRCLACGAYALARYDGDFIGIINRDQAMLWAWGPRS